jgi:two-component system chemotaxis sensor kinase CheA
MASMDNDETLQMFLEEARDHLRDIESDLLSIETEKGPADVELVNKVFRGIHSIKGAAGFFGLTRIKELSHVMENLLNRIRNLEIVPVRRVVESLLKSADVLSTMVESPHTSESTDIEASIALLKAAQVDEPADSAVKGVLDAHGHERFRVSAGELATARKGGKLLYLLSFEMVADADAKGRYPLDLIHELEKTGLIVESALDLGEDGAIGGSTASLPFHVLYATVLDPEMTSLLTGLAVSRIHVVGPDSIVEAGEAPPPPPAKAKASKGKKKEKARGEPEPVVAAAPVPRAPEPTAAPAPVQQTPAVAPRPVQVDPPREVAPAPHPAEDPRAVGGASPASVQAGTGSASLRVNVKVLDRLMTLAGELVLSRNQLMQKVVGRNLTEIQTSSQGLSLIISELQEAVMSTRMQPLSIVFGKFQRVVRDMAGTLGKEIRLDVEGEDVELDKTVIESIGDPLTHLVRNAVDHGIEASPADRENKGKNRQAVVRLHAYHEAGKVVIEVSDDGRGIDTDRVREKALQQKLVDPKILAQMSEKDVINLIFLPGFSTAAQVTEISGRGVGMDVVKTNFTKLGGVIEIESRKGKGSVFRVKLPLTLAIIPSLLVSVQDETYAIPQVSLVELVRIPAKEVRNRIEKIGDALVMRLRGNLLPLVKLSEALGVDQVKFQHPETGEWLVDKRAEVADRRGPVEKESVEERQRRTGSDRRYRSNSAVNIVVLSAGTFQYGLIVDRLHESEEIVVKPLGRHFAGIACYAGATILGDGRVSLILDVVGISKFLSLRDVGGADKNQDDSARKLAKLKDSQSLLLFRGSEREQFAVPLSLVSRLEVIPRQSIEVVGGRRTVQYRGGSLPLVDLADVAQVQPLPDQDSYFVIVFVAGGREVGLLVSQIVDITEASEEFDEATFKQVGILGSAILAGSTTLLVDLWGVVQACLPGFIEARKAKEAARKYRILVVEDSPFYLRQISGFLVDCGYDVVQAVHGADGMAKLESEADIDMILTDIEMPIMDGLEFTRQVRASQKFRHLPVVAVTSLSGEDAMARGKAAGVDSYMVKLDREKITHTVETFISHGRQ